ncbi:MAG: hypothetical protein DRR19_27325 [Candidatus Parabeggiatoa sp. nov. 1]|nr:MAG: hypothetical protein DRR19_27325 [Gammaproteobacteria bacterium]
MPIMAISGFFIGRVYIVAQKKEGTDFTESGIIKYFNNFIVGWVRAFSCPPFKLKVGNVKKLPTLQNT